MSVLDQFSENAATRAAAEFSREIIETIHTESAMAKAKRLAKVETLVRSLEESGNTLAAEALAKSVFCQAEDDMTAGALHFGRQLLADDWSHDTPALRGEVVRPALNGNSNSKRKKNAKVRNTRSEPEE